MGKKRSAAQLQRQRWYRALRLAMLVLAEQGYHTRYLEDLERWLQVQPLVPGTDDGGRCREGAP